MYRVQIFVDYYINIYVYQIFFIKFFVSSIGVLFWICGVSWKKEFFFIFYDYLVMMYKMSIILNLKLIVFDMNCLRKLKCMYLIFYFCLCSNMNVYVNI